ncbi:MAG: hypothetical protein E7622_07490 [Ruminococcaceae bacterium]|nr:hypothetical protein [Oscillospiraceae bacterium]
MGLFGYNEKDYNKGTAQIKSRIEDIHSRTRYISGAGESGVGMILSKIGRLADREFPKTKKLDGKEMQSIEQRIAHIVDLMDDDVQNENLPGLSSHAELLFDLIKTERLNGKKFYTDEYLKHGEIKAQAMGGMLKALEKKAKLQEKIAELKADARRAKDAGDMVELEKIDLEYQECNTKIDDCDASLQDWKLNYDQAVQIQSELDKEKEVDEITSADLMSPEKFAMRVSKINEKLGRHIDKAAGIRETYEEAKAERNALRGSVKSSRGSIMDDIQQEDALNAQKNIANASAPAGQQKQEFKVSPGLLD